MEQAGSLNENIAKNSKTQGQLEIPPLPFHRPPGLDYGSGWVLITGARTEF